MVHGENAFLGSTLDPLHPSNLNTEVLESNKLYNKVIEDAQSLEDKEQDDVGNKSGATKKNFGDRRVKGCPPEVRQQYRELLDAGWVCRLIRFSLLLLLCCRCCVVILFLSLLQVDISSRFSDRH